MVLGKPYASVHIAPTYWPVRLMEVRRELLELHHKAKKTVEFITKRKERGQITLDPYERGDAVFNNGLQGIILEHLEPIGAEFAQHLEDQKFNVKKFPSYAAQRVLRGELVQASPHDIADFTYAILHDSETLRLEPDLFRQRVRRFAKFLDVLGKNPTGEQTSLLEGVCLDYFMGVPSKSGKRIAEMVSKLPNKRYLDIESSTTGTCYYAENPEGIGFQFAVTLPDRLLVSKDENLGTIGGHIDHVLPGTKAQYDLIVVNPPYTSTEVQPLHLPPIVGSSLTEASFKRFKPFIPTDAFEYAYTAVSRSGKEVQTTLDREVFRR